MMSTVGRLVPFDRRLEASRSILFAPGRDPAGPIASLALRMSSRSLSARLSSTIVRAAQATSPGLCAADRGSAATGRVLSSPDRGSHGTDCVLSTPDRGSHGIGRVLSTPDRGSAATGRVLSTPDRGSQGTDCVLSSPDRGSAATGRVLSASGSRFAAPDRGSHGTGRVLSASGSRFASDGPHLVRSCSGFAVDEPRLSAPAGGSQGTNRVGRTAPEPPDAYDAEEAATAFRFVRFTTSTGWTSWSKRFVDPRFVLSMHRRGASAGRPVDATACVPSMPACRHARAGFEARPPSPEPTPDDGRNVRRRR